LASDEAPEKVSMQTPEEREVDRLKKEGGVSSLPESYLLGSVLAVTALVYVATLHFQFVYDDQNQIVRNLLVQSWHFVPGYFRGKQWEALFPNASVNYYRPLNFVWFRLNDALFGLQAAGWHATTVLLHLFATFLAYAVARRVTGRPLVAALAALLFGVHPTRHEVVAWVSGATESLWVVFFFLAFLAYLKSREGNRVRWVSISCVCYGAGLLAKETAIVLPLVIFAHAWLYGTQAPAEDGRKSLWHSLSKSVGLSAVYGVVALAYLVLRISVLHGFEHPQSNIPLRTFVLTLPSVLFFYVRQWLLPMHVGEFYDLPLQSRFDAWHVLAPFSALLLLAVCLWLVRKRLGSREVGFAAVWMIAPLLPVLDFAVLAPGQLVHDRYFYLSGFGAALLSALVLGKLATGKLVFGVPRRLLIPTLALLVLTCYSTADAASYWIDDYTLFQHDYQLAPANVVARVNYAIALARRRDYFTAMRLLTGVLNEQPNNWLANYNLGRVYYDMGILPAAEGRFEQVRKVYPTMPDNYLQLGLIDLKTNRPAEAEENMRHATELQPKEPTFHFSLGVVLETEGKCDEARSEFGEALTLDPAFPKAREQMTKCGVESRQDASPGAAGREQVSPAGALPAAETRVPDAR
jgi:protein O-mannosyl-transferase